MSPFLLCPPPLFMARPTLDECAEEAPAAPRSPGDRPQYGIRPEHTPLVGTGRVSRKRQYRIVRMHHARWRTTRRHLNLGLKLRRLVRRGRKITSHMNDHHAMLPGKLLKISRQKSLPQCHFWGSDEETTQANGPRDISTLHSLNDSENDYVS